MQMLNIRITSRKRHRYKIMCISALTVKPVTYICWNQKFSCVQVGCILVYTSGIYMYLYHFTIVNHWGYFRNNFVYIYTECECAKVRPKVIVAVKRKSAQMP